MAKRRVVVTGMGAVTPIGLSVDEFWQSIKAQKTGFSEITKFDTTNYKCKLAAEVKELMQKIRWMQKKQGAWNYSASMPWRQRRRQLRMPGLKWIRKIRIWQAVPLEAAWEAFRRSSANIQG